MHLQPTHLSHTPPWHRALRCLGLSLLVWGLFAVALGAGSHVDQLRAGRASSLPGAIGAMLPHFATQVLFSALIGWVLGSRATLVERPRQLAALALPALLGYSAVSLVVNAALRTLLAGDGGAGFEKRVQEWSGTQVWVDGMISGGAMLAQMAWFSWRLAQVRQADNLRLRLELLQGQLEPHFLFNTLNSISALVRAARPDVALQAINRLSDLLRYALRASQVRVVSVADELRFVQDYVALQHLRFGSALQWEPQIGASDWAEWACPPLLLQPLVENAIRHGLEAGHDGPLRMVVRGDAGILVLELSNSYATEVTPSPGHGVGLAKSRERLQVLYGARAGIATRVERDRFHLELTLPLERLDAALERIDR